MFVNQAARAKGNHFKALALAFAALSSIGCGTHARAAEPVGFYPAPALESSDAIRMLGAQIGNLGRSFDGDIGIAVKDIQTDELVEFDGAIARDHVAYSDGPEALEGRVVGGLVARSQDRHRSATWNHSDGIQ